MTAQLQIRTRRQAEGTCQEETLTAAGVYRQTPRGWQVTYPEGEGVTVVLAAAPGEVTVTRRGAARSRLVFRPGERYEGLYGTPYGAFDLALTAHTVRYDLSPAGGRVELGYVLTLGGGDADMEITVDIRTDQPKGI